MRIRSFPPFGLALLAGAVALGCSMGDPARPAAPSVAPTLDESASTPAAASCTPKDDVGAVVLHRLNATEYDNTVRDLLGATDRYSATFPPDDGAGSFDNVAAALTVSPLLFEKYEAAATALAERASRDARFVTCDGTGPGGESACAEAILARLARRAWRTSVTSADTSRLVRLVGVARQEGATFREGIALAMKATLLSPRFLFRVERDPVPDDPAPRALDDFELASRLSYFLWSSMPDDALFAYAEVGKLAEPRVYDEQVRRMLVDPKARALVDGFATQWLVRTLGDAAPDPVAFPSFDEGLRASMRGETLAFLTPLLLGGESLRAIFNADYTYLDDRMASHYGIAGSFGAAFSRVGVGPDTHRGGLLAQASVLTMTSVPTRTSAVRRGEWILSELLCSPPPPPPPGIPPFAPTTNAATMRERLAEHRKNPLCATCHDVMDPLGLAFEHYDGLGRWRADDRGQAIDVSGKTADGQSFDGARDLAAILAKDPRFARCATKKLYAYALGRLVEPYDAPRLATLTSTLVDRDLRARDLIVEIAHSDAFRMRRGGDARAEGCP